MEPPPARMPKMPHICTALQLRGSLSKLKGFVQLQIHHLTLH
jgi:hypothetical protein